MSKTAEVLTFTAKALVATVGWIIGLLWMIAHDVSVDPICDRTTCRGCH